MPIRLIEDPEEWERLTGERGSVYIESAPKRRRPKVAELDWPDKGWGTFGRSRLRLPCAGKWARRL